LGRPPRTRGRAPPQGDCRASRTAAAGALGARRTARAPGPGRAGGGRQGRGSTGRRHRSGRPGGGVCAAPRPVRPFTNSIVAVARLRQSRRCHGVRCARGGQGGSMNWNFGTVFESVADAIPEHAALVQDGRRRTWREFDERAARLAAALRDLGLGPDSKIAFYLYNCNEYLEVLLATFKLRAV